MRTALDQSLTFGDLAGTDRAVPLPRPLPEDPRADVRKAAARALVPQAARVGAGRSR